MKPEPGTPIHELSSVLAEHLNWHGARISFLANFILALLKVRTVNLAQLAIAFSGCAKVASNYKRLQRFFCSFEFSQESIAKIVVQLIPVGDGPWTLTMDRTNWKFGKTHINLLVLGIAYLGIAIPIFWIVLDKAGNSNTAERIALLERFIALFGVSKIAVLLADREFVGGDWLRWLQKLGIPFHQRIKYDTMIPDCWNRWISLGAMFSMLKPGEFLMLKGRRPIWGCFVYLTGLRLENGELLIIATFLAPQEQAIEAYADRWQIETLFGCLKSRGFNFEDTHITDPNRLSKMLGLLVLAFAWAYRMGEVLNGEKSPIPFKETLQRPLKSLFRHGLDFLRNIVLNLHEKIEDFMYALQFLSCPAPNTAATGVT
jgi:hypothetical protein